MTLFCLYGTSFLSWGFAFYYFLKGFKLKSKDYLKASGIKFMKGTILFVLAFLLNLFYEVGNKINIEAGKRVVNLVLIDNILFGLIIALGILIIVKRRRSKTKNE